MWSSHRSRKFKTQHPLQRETVSKPGVEGNVLRPIKPRLSSRSTWVWPHRLQRSEAAGPAQKAASAARPAGGTSLGSDGGPGLPSGVMNTSWAHKTHCALLKGKNYGISKLHFNKGAIEKECRASLVVWWLTACFQGERLAWVLSLARELEPTWRN